MNEPMNNTIKVAEKLYYEQNPDTKKDVPSFIYELVEKWRKEWIYYKSELSLYEYIKINKSKK